MTASTVIGNVASPADVLVGRSGELVAAGGLTLDCWVIAGDRVHRPSSEAGTATTQERVGGAPVVATSLRIPGGHLLRHAWTVAAPGGDVAVVEVDNRSTTAVGIALVVSAGPHGRRLAFDGDRTVAVTGRGRPARLVFGRVPGRVAIGDDDELERAVTVPGGGRVGAGGSFDGADRAVFVFALAHTARLRAAIPLGDDGVPADPGDLDALPDAEQVARGWQEHVDAGTRIGLPDPRLLDATVAARTTLLVRHDRRRPAADAATVARALAQWGHGEAAWASIEPAVAAQRLDGRFGRGDDADETTATVLAALAAWSRLVDRGQPDALGAAAELAGPVAKAAHRLARRHRRGATPPWFAGAQHAAAELLDRAGHPEAADLCRSRGGVAPAAGTVDLGALDLDAAAGPELLGAPAVLGAVRALLVDDTTPGELRLLTTYPDGWLGQDVDVHRLPTAAGTLGFAVRWHGPRPAILWELHADGPVRLTVPGLDPAWSSDEPVGEALLGLVEPAGGLPKVVAPIAGGTPADDAAESGSSFA